MKTSENPERIAYISERLRNSLPALEAIEEAKQSSDITLSRVGYRAISSAFEKPSTFSGKTYGLLVDMALLNQIPEEVLPAETIVQYGRHSPIRFVDAPVLPASRYVPPSLKAGINGLVVESLQQYVSEVEAIVETGIPTNVEDLPHDVLSRRIKEATGQKVSIGTLGHWQLVCDVVLHTDKYLED